MPTRRPSPPPDLSEAATRVLRRFRLVFNTVKAHFQQVERQAGIGGAQLWALSLIENRPGIGTGELARAMDVHPSTASNLVRALLARGLVQADKGGADRRAVQLTLLPAGNAVLNKAPGPLSGVLPQALASLDAETLARLDEDLARLVGVLEDGDEHAAKVPLGR